MSPAAGRSGGPVTLVLPSPLGDDYVVTPEAEAVLDRLLVCVVRDPGSGDPPLAEGEILVTGLERQAAPAVEFVRRMPRLRWIHSVTAGIADLLAPELVERAIVVTNSAGVYAGAIAEYSLAALVLLGRRIPELLRAAGERRWVDEHPLGRELAGRQVGIVGYGGIGRALARLCTQAGMRVRAVSRTPTEVGTHDPAERVLTVDRLSELLAWSDFVVVAASLNPSSHGLIGAAELEAVKPGAFLVNVSRGALVDERALVTALSTGRLAGAMIDVTADEPLPAASELWDAPNLWITPHMAGGTMEGRARALDLLVANVERYLDRGAEALLNVVEIARELEPVA
jgi:phosphoglycerate dehydrogenase-like enzyme